MNLRQINRNQKLSNFNYKLIDFISEADEEEVSYRAVGPGGKTETKTMAISAALKQKTDHPARIAAEKLRGAEDEPAEKAADDVPATDPSSQDPEGRDIEAVDDFMDDTSDEEDTKPLSDKEVDALVKDHFPGGPGQIGNYNAQDQTGDPSDPSWPNDAIAKQTSWDTGHSKGQPPAKKKSTSTGRPIEAAPGDAGSLFNELGSNEAADLLYKLQDTGDNLSDEQIAQILDKQFGETHAAIQNGAGSSDPKRKKEYADKLLAAARAGRRKNNRMKTALENAEEQGFGKVENTETFYGSADSIQAAKNQVAGANKFFGQDGEITEVPSDDRTKDEFRESIGSSQLAAARKLTNYPKKTDRATLEKLWEKGELPFPPDLIKLEKGDSGKIVGINEEAMNDYINNLFPENENERRDPEKIKAFMEAVVLSAGGGNNPADTTTVIKDENGNLIVLQHSDKANLKAQLANSTPAKEFDRAGEEIDRMLGNGDLTGAAAGQALAINDEAGEQIKEIEERLADVKEQPLKDLAEFVSDRDRAIQIINVLNKPDGDSTLKDRWDKYRNQPPRNKMSNVEALQDFMNLLADPDHKVTGPENRMIEKLRAQMVKNPDRVTDSDGNPWGASQLDSSQAQAEIRKDTVKILQDRVEALNAIETEDGNRLGDVVETRKLIDMLHLYQMDEPSRGVYVSGMTETVAGADGVTKENLRRCLGVENSNDLIGKIKVGPPQIPEGENYVSDKELGVPEAFLVRNTKEPEVNKEGATLYWLYKDGKKVSKTDNEEAAKNSRNEEDTIPSQQKPAEPVGTVTAQKAMAYYEDEETGERFEIATMSTRAKGGPQAPLGTGYAWSPDMQKCLEGKTDKIGESYSSLERIISEMKQNSLRHHWAKAEDDYPAHYFIREINEGSLI